MAPGFRPRTQYINSAPLYFDGILYTGLSGGDRALRGRITALDAKTGRELWRFFDTNTKAIAHRGLKNREHHMRGSLT